MLGSCCSSWPSHERALPSDTSSLSINTPDPLHPCDPSYHSIPRSQSPCPSNTSSSPTTITQKGSAIFDDKMHSSPSPRPCKRQRMMVTPPSTIHDSESTSILDRATRVLSIEATALSHVTRLYQTDPHARKGLLGAVECITRSQAAGGKVIVCGVGKSGLVGRKTVATLKSLSIAASFMHAAEAAHGDLGDIREVCQAL